MATPLRVAVENLRAFSRLRRFLSCPYSCCVRLARRPLLSALFRRRMALLFPATRTTLLTAFGFLVDGSPSSPRCFFRRCSAFLVALFNVFGLTLLLAGV